MYIRVGEFHNPGCHAASAVEMPGSSAGLALQVNFSRDIHAEVGFY